MFPRIVLKFFRTRAFSLLRSMLISFYAYTDYTCAQMQAKNIIICYLLFALKQFVPPTLILCIATVCLS